MKDLIYSYSLDLQGKLDEKKAVKLQMKKSKSKAIEGNKSTVTIKTLLCEVSLIHSKLFTGGFCDIAQPYKLFTFQNWRYDDSLFLS